MKGADAGALSFADAPAFAEPLRFGGVGVVAFCAGSETGSAVATFLEEVVAAAFTVFVGEGFFWSEFFAGTILFGTTAFSAATAFFACADFFVGATDLEDEATFEEAVGLVVAAFLAMAAFLTGAAFLAATFLAAFWSAANFFPTEGFLEEGDSEAPFTEARAMDAGATVRFALAGAAFALPTAFSPPVTGLRFCTSFSLDAGYDTRT